MSSVANFCLQATCAFVALMLHSVSPLRHAFYETFIHLHIIFAVLSFVGLWVHLEGLEAQKYLLVAIIFWALEVCAI